MCVGLVCKPLNATEWKRRSLQALLILFSGYCETSVRNYPNSRLEGRGGCRGTCEENQANHTWAKEAAAMEVVH